MSAAGLAIGSLGYFGNETLLLASAVLLLIIADRRRTKVVTTSYIQFVDKDGKRLGHARWNGEKIAIGIFVSNFSALKPGFWRTDRAFSSPYSSHKTIAAESEPELPVPQIRVHNYPISRGKSYSYSLDFSRLGDEPSLEIMQVGFDEGAKQSIVKQWQVIREKWTG